jgi:archaellum component FlaG (FlaF/FlaG flagellin family)
MKRHLALIILISLLLLFNSITMANALEINNNEVNFDISPEKINKHSYVPINQFNQMEDFLMEKLQDNRYLIIYNNKYFIISTNDKLIKSSQGEFTLNKKPISVNEHLLVPFQLINEIFNDDHIKQKEDQGNRLELKVTTDQQTYSNKDSIEVKMKIINNSNEDITLEFNSGQKYDIFIKNKNNEIFYNWADNQMFIQAFVSETINANSTLIYQENIDISGLSQGNYFLEVELTDQKYGLKAQPIKFEIN